VVDLFQHLENVVFRRGFNGALDVLHTDVRSGSQSGALALTRDDDTRPTLAQERVGLIQVDEAHFRPQR
jgi:hypothetical protein